MSELINPKIDVFSLSLDGFEGPIDLLLSLARDHKIDLTKLSILKLAEQYLEFLDHAIKRILISQLSIWLWELGLLF